MIVVNYIMPLGGIDWETISHDFNGIYKSTGGNITFYLKNGKRHREDGPACISFHTMISWYYNGVWHGENEDFTNETWIEFVENLKREEELKIFI